jgi:hypothetical protein
VSDGADDTTDVASHVAVEIDRAWCDDVTAALADVAASSGDPDLDAVINRLDRVLDRWWTRREARLDVATVPLDDAVRAELVAALAGEELLPELAATAPVVVRTAALARLRMFARQLRALTDVGAPAMMLDAHRVHLARLLGELDPRAPRERDSTPLGGSVGDVAGNQVVDVNTWLDRMLVAAVVDAPSVGLGDAFGQRPEAKSFLAGNGEAPAVSVRVWPGLVTLGVNPDLAFWASPAIALPHRIEVPAVPPALVAAESSGPITYAVAGDVLDAALVPELAERARGLAKDRALLSFVWLATDSAGPWRPLG